MSPTLSPPARIQMVAPGVIVVLVVAAVISIATLVVGWVPLAVDETPWRFRAAAQLLSSGPQLAILLALIALTGVVGEQNRAVRWASGGAILLALLLSIVVPFFALDLIAMRRLQHDDVVDAFTRDGLRLGVTSGVLMLALLWVARLGFVAVRIDPSEKKAKGDGLIVGQIETPL